MASSRSDSVSARLWTWRLLTAFAVVAGHGSLSHAQIQWKNHRVDDEAHRTILSVGERAGLAAPSSPDDEAPQPPTLDSDTPPNHVLVRFQVPLGFEQRDALDASGVKLLSYVGDNSYFASLQGTDLSAVANSAGPALRVEAIPLAAKIHPGFYTGQVLNAPAWSVTSGGDTDDPQVAAYVAFHADVPLEPNGLAAVRRHGGMVISMLRSVSALVIVLPQSRIEALAGDDEVQWIEPPLPRWDTNNDGIRSAIQAETVQTTPPYELDGSGVGVMVYDGGTSDPTHPDLTGRVFVRDPSALSAHAIHVSGTIGGDGFASSGLWRGMAPGVTMESYYFSTPGGFAEGSLYADPGDLEGDYEEAINTYGVDIANNSIGTNICGNGFNCDWTGDYGLTSQLIDAIVVGSLGRPMRIVWAAGNERSCDRCVEEGASTLEGFRSIPPPSGAKNHISVGAVNSDDLSVTPFTSWGPTDDGRLKPDLVAPGCQTANDYGITSPELINGYSSLCGTSMAAPTVTGATALLLQDFRIQFPGRSDPLSSTVKALFINTTLDLDLTGPDYKTGYGLIQVKDAIDLMRTGQFTEGAIGQHDRFSLFVTVSPGDGPLALTLAWDDLPGTPNVVPSLVNDLDLRVVDPNGMRHHPWTLDPDQPAAPAVQGFPDRLNNVEQIYVPAPTAGLWLIEVHGYSLPAASQAFSLCVSAPFEIDCDSDGTPDAEQILADPSLDCGENGLLDSCELDCNDDEVADSCEILDGGDRDCNRNGIPDGCEPFADCNGNGRSDACEIADDESTDCNDNFIPDECEPDCNGNGIADECDIRDLVADDCDGDGQPDSCQSLADCNGNGTPDACETADRSVDDFNNNGVPDECEANGRTISVDVNACSGDGGDGSPGNAFCTIQDGIDVAISGDIVVVAPGIYSGVRNRNLDFRGRLITVQSIDPSDETIVATTIIDCDHRGRGFFFHSGESHDDRRRSDDSKRFGGAGHDGRNISRCGHLLC